VQQNPCARSITAFIGAAIIGLLGLQIDIASQTTATAQDPGPRIGVPGAGAPLDGLT
jgi:hypothetical protein